METSDIMPFTLITGASSGIGKALAFECAARELNLLLVALPGTGLNKVTSEITTEYQVVVKALEIDLTETCACSKVHQWCRENHWHVNMLINNAGFGNLEFFENSNLELLEKMVLLNNLAVVSLCRTFIPDLKQFKKSYLLNVSSLGAFLPLPRKSVYVASKRFIYAFSQVLRFELNVYKIKVSCLCPGSTATSRALEILQQMKFKPNAFCMLPEQVAKEAIDKMFQGCFRIIPGWRNRILFLLIGLLPPTLKALIVCRIFNREQRMTSKMVPAYSRKLNLVPAVF